MKEILVLLPLIVLGCSTGLMSGLLGVGGALFVIPALMLWMGFSQKLAQGTALAMMLPPIGLLAVLTYHHKGFVDWKTAGILCLASVAGTALGAKLAVQLPTGILQKFFGIYLLVVGCKLLFFSGSK